MLDGIVTSIVTELERQSGKSGVTAVSVMAVDPARPVIAVTEFADHTRHTIPDCYGLAATDSVFSAVFVAAMTELARQAGLTVS
jgi:hypothetical protein